ncbi:uncharacterized protein LOC135841398 [Planococcus citri]|uniref:uncharacterized protein LOC135841398 n=1 Tax=Planococcus citri TaxID=170843 RepID=UPI0031F7F32A
MLLMSLNAVFLILLSLDKSTTALSTKGSSTQFQTQDPINIVPSKVKTIFLAPLIVLENAFDNILVNNTGRSVRLIEDDPITANIITGGVLGFEIYVYGETIFYWANSSYGVAYTTVEDEIRAPLVACIMYYNKRYKSFNDALHYSNGIAKICFPINVGPIDNPLFVPFALSLKEIQQPKSSVKIKLLPAFIFYAITPPLSKYYAYHGSIQDDESGKTYYCTTTIIAPQLPYHFISKKQFHDTFLQLHGPNGKKLVNNPQPAPQGMSKVVQSYGILKIINFIKTPTRIGSQ